MSLRTYLERNEVFLKAIAAIVVTCAGGLWAVIELLYPDVIKPLISPPRIETEISSEEVARSEKYSTHLIKFLIKNNGLSTIYLPSAYFVVLAKMASTEEHQTKKKLSQSSNDNLKSFLSGLSDTQRRQLVIEAENLLFRKKWEEALPTSLSRPCMEMRSGLQFDTKEVRIIQAGKINGTTEILDPGDSIKFQTIALIPAGFSAFEATISTNFSKHKDVGEKYVFVGIPNQEYRIMMITIPRGADLKDELKDFSQRVAKISKDEMARTNSYLRKNEVMQETRCVQMPIIQPVSATKPAPT